MPLSLDFDSHFLYSQAGTSVAGLISPETQHASQATVSSAVDVVTADLQAGKYGFVNAIKNDEWVQQTQNVWREVTRAGWVRALVVVGIGGSDLGARAVQQALEDEARERAEVLGRRVARSGQTPPVRVLFHGDSTDPVQIRQLWRQIKLEETVFVIVSKSGQTVETLTQYLYWKEQYAKRKAHWAQHFLFVTDSASGLLHDEAQKHGVKTLPIPGDVGGRFSVLTPVGLLPALVMGVDISALVHGAREAIADAHFCALAAQFATTQFQLWKQGTQLTVMMAYSVQLEEFARWFRQLWAESLGKDGKGILPIQARGPADQHSQGQFYQQGALLQSLLFVRIAERGVQYRLGEVDIPEAAYLSNCDFHTLINIEQQANAQALYEQGRPSATLTVQCLNAASLGQLFMFFELAVVYLAAMLGVNAFDQPGVEASKQVMYHLLGKN